MILPSYIQILISRLTSNSNKSKCFQLLRLSCFLSLLSIVIYQCYVMSANHFLSRILNIKVNIFTTTTTIDQMK